MSNRISCGTKLNTSMQTNPLSWRKVNEQLEARNTKEASIAQRKQIIDDQKRINYSMVMSNIRGVLGSKILPFQTVARLKSRHDELNQIGGNRRIYHCVHIFILFNYQKQSSISNKRFR